MSTAKAPKYLVIAADTYPPVRVDVSVLFGRELAARGHDVDWLLQSGERLDSRREVKWGSWRVFAGATDLGTSLFHRVRKHLLGLANDLSVFRLSRANRYDFIQVKDKFLSALLAILAARRNRCGFVYWLSYPYPEASIYESRVGTARYRLLYLIRGIGFKLLLYRIILPSADHIFVQSEQMKRDVVAEGADASRISVVPMGYTPADLATIELPELDTSQLPIVYIGTLLQTRRFDFLIRVLALVLEQMPDAVLYMVGPEELPGDEAVLAGEAERLGIRDRLVMTGRVSRPLALGYVKRARVCVSPFYPTPILNSTSPTKLIEYMAVGRPVVANDHPEQRLVIRESGGGLCVPYAERQFADAILALLSDQARAEAMGKKGEEYVARSRTYAVIADRVDAEYRSLTARLRTDRNGASES